MYYIFHLMGDMESIFSHAHLRNKTNASAAVCIQKHWRGKSFRKAYQRRRSAAMAIQTRMRVHLHPEDKREYEAKGKSGDESWDESEGESEGQSQSKDEGEQRHQTKDLVGKQRENIESATAGFIEGQERHESKDERFEDLVAKQREDLESKKARFVELQKKLNVEKPRWDSFGGEEGEDEGECESEGENEDEHIDGLQKELINVEKTRAGSGVDYVDDSEGEGESEGEDEGEGESEGEGGSESESESAGAE